MSEEETEREKLLKEAGYRSAKPPCCEICVKSFWKRRSFFNFYSDMYQEIPGRALMCDVLRLSKKEFHKDCGEAIEVDPDCICNGYTPECWPKREDEG